MDARGGARTYRSCLTTCGRGAHAEMDRRAGQDDRGGRAHRDVAIPAGRPGPVRGVWRWVRRSDPVAWRRACAVLRLYVVLETRSRGLRQRPRRPYRSDRRGGARDIGRRHPAAVRRGTRGGAWRSRSCSRGRPRTRQGQLESELAALDAEHDELMASVRRGGDVAVLARLVGRLQAIQARRQTLTTTRPSESDDLAPGRPRGARGPHSREAGRLARTAHAERGERA